MKKQYLIGLDIGTSSAKGVLLAADGSGEPVSDRFPFEYRQEHRPEGNRLELDADVYLDTLCRLLRSLSARLPGDGVLAGVCAASASGNLLLLGPDGTPATPIFNWQDRRITDEVTRVLGADFDRDAYYRSTGWAFDGVSFPLATLCWLYCHQPADLAAASAVCMSTEYLYRFLTGSFAISTSAGTPFYLIDQVTGTYRQDMLERFGIPPEKLPPVVPVGSLCGRVTAAAAQKTGLPAGTPVFAGTFDHPSAARGVGILQQGQLLLSCGTSWVGFFPTDDRALLEQNRMLIDPFLSASGGPWAGMVSLASVATKIHEYICRYIDGSEAKYRIFHNASKQSRSGAGGLRIYMDENDDPERIAAYPRYHIARAIMECVVGRLKADFDRLAAGGISATSAVMVGGPSESPFWTTVIKEITGLPVEIRHGAFAGARGACIVAGMGAGLWANEAEALKIIG